MKFLVQSVLLLWLTTGLSLASDLAILRNGFSIRHERREQIGAITRLYLSIDGSNYADVPTVQVDHFEKDLFTPKTPPQAASPEKIDDVIATTGRRHRIDPDLIASVIHAESGFNSQAVSRKGAQGLMQLMPQTASRLGVRNAFDPQANVDGGTRYLRELLVRYNFDLIKALAAYNAGPQRVEQYGGVPPYRETRAYVTRIVKDFNRKKLAERKSAVVKTAAKAPAKTPSTQANKTAALSSSSPSQSR